MYQKALRKKQRRGNLLVVVLLMAVIASLLTSAFISASHSLSQAEEQSSSIMDIYNGLALADVFTDAFIADLDMQYRQEPIPAGTTEINREFYETMIANTEGFIANMNMTLSSDGRYLYKGDAELVAEDIAFEDSFSGGIYRPSQVSMETRFLEVVKKIDSFEIYLDKKLTPDATNVNNILSGKSGDRYYLEDVIMNLQFEMGAYRFQRAYRISNLYAQFTHSGMIMCDIQTDEIVVTLESQSVK